MNILLQHKILTGIISINRGLGVPSKLTIVLYLKWITNKDPRYSTQNSTQCYVAAGMGGGLGEKGYMYMYG